MCSCLGTQRVPTHLCETFTQTEGNEQKKAACSVCQRGLLVDFQYDYGACIVEYERRFGSCRRGHLPETLGIEYARYRVAVYVKDAAGLFFSPD